MASDIGGFFKWLNSPALDEWFNVKLTKDNKGEIIEEMMVSPDFIDTAKGFIEDAAIIRNKLETKIGQVLKKKNTTAVIKSDDADEAIVVSEDAVEFPDFDEENGKHVGCGIYLKQEGHVTKMTTPNFTVYY
jgi:hypothetical protein